MSRSWIRSDGVGCLPRREAPCGGGGEVEDVSDILVWRKRRAMDSQARIVRAAKIAMMDRLDRGFFGSRFRWKGRREDSR